MYSAKQLWNWVILLTSQAAGLIKSVQMLHQTVFPKFEHTEAEPKSFVENISKSIFLYDFFFIHTSLKYIP